MKVVIEADIFTRAQTTYPLERGKPGFSYVMAALEVLARIVASECGGERQGVASQ
jgi:hypothetical protein